MFGRLVEKELRHLLVDLRFVAVFGLCTLLSALSVYVGGQTYRAKLREHGVVSEANRRAVQKLLEGKSLWNVASKGYRWNRKPERLSPVVFGLSGTLGRQVEVRLERPAGFTSSLYESEGMYALLDVLDFAFVVKFVLSLAVLLFTHDAVCGEKENGTLRLYASFPVRRSTLALAKLVGATVAVLIPFLFAYLIVVLVLAISSGIGLEGDDWMRVAALAGVSALYLTAFAGFGLWISALTHRRLTAFLCLLGLWTLWIYIVPNLAVNAARPLAPVKSVYDQARQAQAARREIRDERRAELNAFYTRNVPGRWRDLSEARRQEIQVDASRIEERWDGEFYHRLADHRTERRNQIRAQQRLAMTLSAISPLSAVSFASMDLARTGFLQQERLEDALNVHLAGLAQYVRKKFAQPRDEWILSDFPWFTYQDRETAGTCVARNALPIMNLALLAILGFAGAYVAILKYDVR
jgi:hypothetical protein